MNRNELDNFAQTLIQEAGRRIRDSFDNTLTIQTKSHVNDLVTNVDKATEQYFIEQIVSRFPSHRIMGEEGFGHTITHLDGVVWMIDPIDGTMNFIHQKRNFMISVGIFLDGEGILGYIYDVMHDELYAAEKGNGATINGTPIPPIEETTFDKAIIGMNASWVVPNRRIEHDGMIDVVKTVRGIRSYGSAAMEIAYVCTGRLDAYLSLRLSPWDIAGGIVIANEVGAIASNLEGEELSLLGQDTVVVANPSIYKELLQHVKLKK